MWYITRASMYLSFPYFYVFYQWGAAFCVRGGPEKEKKAMEVWQASYKIPYKKSEKVVTW